MSRLREKPERLFEAFFEIGKPAAEKDDPFILQKYPLDYNDEEVLKSVPKFAFPCDTERYTTTVDHFTFTLTDLDSQFKFGFCRHATGAQTCLCIISFLPWFEVFYQFLNNLAEITNRSEDNNVEHMLRAAYVQEVPGPGVPVTIVAQQEMVSFKAPEINKLPSIPASRNLTEYYNAIDVNNMMVIFASMVNERRIVVTSKKLSRVTAVIHAASSLLYPMYWQHLFIPVLPVHLTDYLCAPMPFVIGVHMKIFEKVQLAELGDAVIVDADSNTVSTEHEDLDNLPEEISMYLKKHLKGDKVKNSMQGSGDVISKTFMMSLVKLIGGYRDALKFNEGETITFSPEAFVQSRPLSMQPFLENMLHLQIFQQFINDRLDMLNCGRGFADVFEQECLLHADRLNSQTRYNEWLSKMKKQGKKMTRDGKDIWSGFKVKARPVMKEAMGYMDSVTHRAGPAMSSAVESVKTQGKKAYSRARKGINDLKKDDEGTPKHHKLEGTTPKQQKSVRAGPKTKSFSKEKPPGIIRDRPSTIVGPPLTTQRVETLQGNVGKPPRPNMSPDIPDRPIVTVSHPASERSTRYTSHIHHPDMRTSADDNDVLVYSRVSCNLMADPDIQHAMFKSASAENLPKSDPTLKASSSSGTITSGSSLDPDQDHPSVPYMDDHDHGGGAWGGEHPGSESFGYTNLLDDDDSGIVMRTSSQTSLDKSRQDYTRGDTSGYSRADTSGSSIGGGVNIAPPRPLPRKTVSPQVAPVEDRLITGGAGRERPRPAPRKPSLDNSTQQEAADLLISLETPTNEKEEFNLSEFENLKGSGEYVVLREPKTVTRSAESNGRRSSISRTPAMKLAQGETPNRPSIRRERSPVSPDEDVTPHGQGPTSIFDFDPLSGGQPEQKQSQSTSKPSDNSESLLKDWEIRDLATMNIGSKAAPSVAPNIGSNVYGYGHPTPPPRQTTSSVPKPTFYTPQNYSSSQSGHGLPKVLNFDNPIAQTPKPTPVVPPRPKDRPYSAYYGGFPQEQTPSKQDPFADLVSLNQPKPAPRGQGQVPSNTPPPRPPKKSWETFD